MSARPAPVRLYCFPHAGSSASVFRTWRPLAPATLSVHGVDPPGRGARARRPPVTAYRDLVTALAADVVADLETAGPDVPGVRWATFGHSFGTTVSLAVGAAVARATGHPPERAFLSAGLPPAAYRRFPLADLDDDALLARVRADGGTPTELLASPPMAAILLRLLREDHALRREFVTESGLRVHHPLTTIVARDDEYVPPREMTAWSEHTTAGCRRVEIPGGHFAALADPAGLLRLIDDHLNGAPAATADRSAAGNAR